MNHDKFKEFCFKNQLNICWCTSKWGKFAHDNMVACVLVNYENFYLLKPMINRRELILGIASVGRGDNCFYYQGQEIFNHDTPLNIVKEFFDVIYKPSIFRCNYQYSQQDQSSTGGYVFSKIKESMPDPLDSPVDNAVFEDHSKQREINCIIAILNSEE